MTVRMLPQDLPAAGLCVTGARRWYHQHGLDFETFLREGTPVEELRATGCPLAERACLEAEARVNAEDADGRDE